MRQKNRLSILIPDAEHALLARHVKTCLSQIHGIHIHLMSNEKDKAIRFSRFVKSFSYYPKSNNEMDWISNMNRVVVKHKIDMVMPVYDESARILLKHNDGSNLFKKLVLLPQLDMFEIALNKSLLSNHLKLHHISSPKNFQIDLTDYSGIEERDFPILMKPVLGIGGGNGIKLFKTKQGFINGFKSLKDNGPYVFEEYIIGYDLGCNVLCKEGEIIACTMQKGTVFSEKKFAPQIGLEFLYEQELFEVVNKLMKTLNWTGVANIDLRYDSKDGKFKILEINPRFWATLDASLSAGVNFPYLYFLMSCNRKFESQEYKHIQFLTLKGVLKRLKKNKWLIFNIEFIWKNTSLKYLLKDPLPFIATIANKTKILVKGQKK